MIYNPLVRCLSCNYDLANLTEHRCPECGRGFDPNDRNSFGPRIRRPFRRRIVHHLKKIIVVSMTIWVCLFLLIVSTSYWDNWDTFELVALLHIAWIAAIIVPYGLIVVYPLFLLVMNVPKRYQSKQDHGQPNP